MTRGETAPWSAVGSHQMRRSGIRDTLRPYVLAARRLRHERPTITGLAWSQPISFSQFGEDRFLLRYFEHQPSGFFVDVGAYHPFSASNTYLLYRRGWHGINLEPAPEALRMLRKHRSRDLNLPFAVSSREGDAVFAVAGSFAGLDDGDHLWAGVQGERICVPTRTLSRIFEEYLTPGTRIDLLDVDCEGHDLDVLRSNDWQRYRPTVVLAEAHDQAARQAISAFLASVGYRLLNRLDLTLVFERAR